MRSELQHHIDVTQDALSYYPQCSACQAASSWQGMGSHTRAHANASTLEQTLEQRDAAQHAQHAKLYSPTYWLI